VCRAHVSFRVPSLHRQLWMHDTLLTCVPLTQARIAAMEFYSGPAETCVLVRDAYARLTSACTSTPSRARCRAIACTTARYCLHLLCPSF
jgi:hypothetical protein